VNIYQASKSQFLHHAVRDDIEDVVSRHCRSATGHGVGASEVAAWKHSLLEMAKVLGDDEIPEDAGVAIEYQLLQSSKRIDFVITGEDEASRTKVIIVELKQWSDSRRSDKDANMSARRGGHSGEREGTHETILQADARAAQKKQVVIVQGGPGTGKSEAVSVPNS
jgi:uncharacterized protein